MGQAKWEADVSEVLVKFGVTKEHLQENAAEELASTLQDYHDLAQQYSDMLTKYSYAEKPVRKSGVWSCPDCGKRIQYNHTHCHWCGKRIGWNK